MSSTAEHDQCLTLLDTHQGIFRKVANTYCSRVEDRKDLIQEMSLQVWRSYPRFDGRCKFSTWMYRIALNVAISFHRQESAHHHLLSGDDHLRDLSASTDADPPSDEIQALHRFIEGLDNLNKALVLLYLDDHSQAEIAEILGISATNVATKIARTKERLRQNFATNPSA
jgi:RNA polymerase sigma-70 factor (ECF subfamily)